MKNCPEEKREREQKDAITCANCNNEGHRARDCPEPRKTSRGKGCRNCGQEGHIACNCPNKTRTALRRLHDEGALDHEEMRRILREYDAKKTQEKKDTSAESFVMPQ